MIQKAGEFQELIVITSAQLPKDVNVPERLRSERQITVAVIVVQFALPVKGAVKGLQVADEGPQICAGQAKVRFTGEVARDDLDREDSIRIGGINRDKYYGIHLCSLLTRLFWFLPAAFFAVRWRQRLLRRPVENRGRRGEKAYQKWNDVVRQCQTRYLKYRIECD